MTESVLGTHDILRILPHRYPFLLVDRVVEAKHVDGTTRVGSKVIVIKNVTFNEPFFTGHFPEQPVMPGVLIVEAMAQAGALAYFRKSDGAVDVAIANIREAKFRLPVIPGDTMRITAEVIKDRKSMIVIKCQAHVDGKLAAEAELLAVVGPKGEIHR